MTDGSNYNDLYGTNSYMPGLFGLYAETVIRYLLKKE
jgi:hypothetical protein